MSIPVVLLIITSALGIVTFIGGWRTGLIGPRYRKDQQDEQDKR